LALGLLQANEGNESGRRILGRLVWNEQENSVSVYRSAEQFHFRMVSSGLLRRENLKSYNFIFAFRSLLLHWFYPGVCQHVYLASEDNQLMKTRLCIKGFVLNEMLNF
jgi:hypothetical protein